ncbi:DUF3592 domain-containing protein [Streptomyces justiciae]|uniref:DUF3592 domain-containing protein n=1 Tax=Streptomyces justiciae TaxID=2780140 RepID=UPI0021193025|nr:DUF3592 domain-containing protein [Streptomyces justiciae]MCW8382413.1 hypothetical protein [Streptomyces justiciae]
MAREGQQSGTIIGVGRGQVHRRPGVLGIRQALVHTLGLLGGLLFIILGFALAWDNAAARWHFGDAEKVPAVVIEADYAKPQLKQSASFISVKLTGVHNAQASIDNVLLAPDRLSADNRVTVLYDASRPGHALFPGQLGWTKLMFPGGLLFLVGLVPAVGNGLVIGRRTAVWLRR